MNSKSLLIIQPGKFGDIIICLPIAKWYHEKGYKVYWQCPSMYHELFRNVDYVIPVENPETISPVTKILDLAFGFGGAPQMWWNERCMTYDSFVTAKYDLAGVPLEERWNLQWNRNKKNEQLLYNSWFWSKSYKLVHTQGSIGANIEHIIQTLNNKIEFRVIEKSSFEQFNIFDWYEVIKNAEEIHCIDSSLSNFIEVCPEFESKKKCLYDVRESYHWLKSIYKNNWIIKK